jgi:hypothetical protein
MSLLHSSTRRPSSLKPVDYDHVIDLVDHAKASPRAASPDSQAPTERLPSPDSRAASRQDSNAPLNQRHSLRSEIARKRYSKYQDRHLDEHAGSDGTDEEQALEAGLVDEAGSHNDRGRPRTAGSRKGKTREDSESVIDILYENQRGLFLCGCLTLFSGRALGNMDPSPWTNSAQKTSATNITNAQCPDPSWEWVWKEWSINRTDKVDEGGWEYSFAFSKMFSWHGPSCWNSYVRRRAWIRKRAKKRIPHDVNEAHMLNEEYFTIHPPARRSMSRNSTIPDNNTNRYSISQLASQNMDNESELEDIYDIPTLMSHLKSARIDREKMEVVENFIEHGGDELYHLQERMHEIMAMFVFQASRRVLLAYIFKKFNEASDENKMKTEAGGEANPDMKRRLDNLEAALKHADEEVKRLEFWSDVKDMAEKGDTKAVDESLGWEGWTGIDNSAPKDVISKGKLPGKADCPSDEEGNGTAIQFKRRDSRKEDNEAVGVLRSDKDQGKIEK